MEREVFIEETREEITEFNGVTHGLKSTAESTETSNDVMTGNHADHIRHGRLIYVRMNILWSFVDFIMVVVTRLNYGIRTFERKSFHLKILMSLI